MKTILGGTVDSRIFFECLLKIKLFSENKMKNKLTSTIVQILILFLIISSLHGGTETSSVKFDRSIKSREEAILKFFKERNLDPIEGIWATDDSQYEIAIVKNLFGEHTDWDYLGLITSAQPVRWLVGPSRFKRGEVKVLLKTTASANLFLITWFAANRFRVGGNFNLQNSDFIQVSFSDAPGPMGMTSLVRVFPKKLGPPKNGNQPFSPPPVDDGGKNNLPGPKSGTGFFVTKNHIVTNFHVIANSEDIYVSLPTGKKAKCKVFLKDQNNDLAVLEVIGNSGIENPIPLDLNNSAGEGEKVFTIGFPLPEELGRNSKISDGIVNCSSGIEDDPRFYQISIPIQPGNSGGPLFNKNGKVIGIVTSTLNNTYLLLKKAVISQNVNFALKIDYLKPILPKNNQFENGENSLADAEMIMRKYKSSVVFLESN